MVFKNKANKKEFEHDKERYQIVRDTAWKALLDCNITSLPVDIVAMAEHYNVPIYANSEVGTLEPDEIGLSLKWKGQWVIVYDDTMINTRIRFTIAHELGHILLGHPEECSRKNKFIKNRSEIEEEADKFAARILAPACVLRGLNLKSAEEIMAYCNISLSAARIRANRMMILNERNKFLSSKTEVKVFKNFISYIEKQKNDD